VRASRRDGGRNPDALTAYVRGVEILSAWTNWKNAQRIEEERSGNAKAEAALDAVMDELDPIVDQIIRARAVTLADRQSSRGGSLLPPGRRNRRAHRGQLAHLRVGRIFARLWHGARSDRYGLEPQSLTAKSAAPSSRLRKPI
jgi:hypothetical protein